MDKAPDKIKQMFNNIASKYDCVNNIISFFIHKYIKEKVINKINRDGKFKILDLCCGTGDITNILYKKFPDSEIIGIDFSKNMLKIAKRKHQKITFIEADCNNIPFTNETFDIITMGFGLRNTENYEKVISEIKRVLKQDGIFVHLDFANIDNFCDKIFDTITIIIGKVFSEENAYKYLIASKKKFLKSKELNEIFEKFNFKLLEEKNFAGNTILAKYFKKK